MIKWLRGKLPASAATRARAYSLQDRWLKDIWTPPALRDRDLSKPALGSAMQLPAFSAAVNLLAHEISLLPIRVYRETPDGGRERSMDPPARMLASQWTPEETAVSAMRRFCLSLFQRGRAFALIERSARAVTALRVLDPDSVTRVVAPDGSVGYQITGIGESVTALREDMIEVFWSPYRSPYPVIDGTQDAQPWRVPFVDGWPAIEAGLLAMIFSAHYYGAGMLPHLIIQPLGLTSEDAYRRFAEDVERRIQRAQRRGRKHVVMPEGTEAKAIQTTARDGMLLDAQRWAVEQIARLFGLPPQALADLTQSSYNNVAMADVSLSKHSIAPWAAQIGQELTARLFGPISRLSVELDLRGLERGTFAERTRAVGQMVAGGVFSQNEAREMFGLPAVDGGDQFFTMPGMQPAAVDGGEAGGEQEAPEAGPEEAPVDASDGGEQV